MMHSLFYLCFAAFFFMACKIEVDPEATRVGDSGDFDFSNANANPILAEATPTPEFTKVSTVFLADSCDYDGDNFNIVNDNVRYRQNVSENHSIRKEICDGNIQAMYDGDEIYVFDQIKKEFIKHNLPNDQEFLYENSDDILSIYDEDMLIVFDASTGMFSRREVKNDLNELLILKVVGKNIFYYDQDEVNIYCKQEWQKFEAENEQPVTNGTIITNELFMVGEDTFTLNTLDCNVTKSKTENQ